MDAGRKELKRFWGVCGGVAGGSKVRRGEGVVFWSIGE